MKKIIKTIIMALALAIFMAPVLVLAADDKTDQTNTNLEQKKKELEELDKQIDQYQNQIDTNAKAITGFSEEIEATAPAIAKLQLEIDRAQRQMDLINSEIDLKENDIIDQNRKLADEKDNLSNYLRNMRRKESESLWQTLLRISSLSEYFNQFVQTKKLQARSLEVTKIVNELRDDLIAEKEALEAKRQEYQAVNSTLATKRQELDRMNYESELRIRENENGISDSEKELSVRQSLRRKILDQIFRLQSEGTNIKFGDAFDYAKYASAKTGVRPALIMAVISQESNLGQNVGTGNYPDDMSPSEREAFVRICDKLGLDPKTQRVSKKPTSYEGWGGAMGPAQIMPTKWESIEGDIARLSGDSPVSPWELKHAFLANGFILQGLGAEAYNESAERQAAGRYFAGSYWEEYPWYADQVLEKAKTFEDQIKDLGD